MPTCNCGKTVDDWRGARGHVQFTDGDGHGPKGEVPDDWKDMFGDAGETPGEDGETGHLDDGGDEAPDEGQESAEETKPDSGQSDASDEGRLKRWLTTPLSELLGGGDA